MAFLRATKSSTTRDCESELKEATQGTVGSVMRFHLVCEEVEQWQTCLRQQPLSAAEVGSAFCTQVGMLGRVEPPKYKFLENSPCRIRYASKEKK